MDAGRACGAQLVDQAAPSGGFTDEQAFARLVGLVDDLGFAPEQRSSAARGSSGSALPVPGAGGVRRRDRLFAAPGADAGRDGRPLYPGHSRAARPVRRTRSMPCAPRRNRPQAADGQVSHARPGGEEPIHEPGGGGGHGGDIRVARDGAGRLVPGDAVEVPRARGHRAHWPGHRTPGLPCPQYRRSGPRRRVGGRVRRRRRGGPQRGVECGRRGRPGGAAGADPATVDAPVEPGPHRCEITRIA